MKQNKPKKEKRAFDPITHWYSLLLAMVVILLLVIGYSVYSFIYIKGEIALIDAESKNNAQSATGDYDEKTKENQQFTKDINALNAKIEEFSKKEKTYNTLIQSPVLSVFPASTAASTTIATSTN